MLLLSGEAFRVCVVPFFSAEDNTDAMCSVHHIVNGLMAVLVGEFNRLQWFNRASNRGKDPTAAVHKLIARRTFC